MLRQLSVAGIDLPGVTSQLEREGLVKFEKSWGELNATVAAALHRSSNR